MLVDKMILRFMWNHLNRLRVTTSLIFTLAKLSLTLKLFFFFSNRKCPLGRTLIIEFLEHNIVSVLDDHIIAIIVMRTSL